MEPMLLSPCINTMSGNLVAVFITIRQWQGRLRKLLVTTQRMKHSICLNVKFPLCWYYFLVNVYKRHNLSSHVLLTWRPLFPPTSLSSTFAADIFQILDCSAQLLAVVHTFLYILHIWLLVLTIKMPDHKNCVFHLPHSFRICFQMALLCSAGHF